MNTLVNMLPPSRRRRYLELGIYSGHNFEAVQAETKVSVDTQVIRPECPPTFVCTTDEYFKRHIKPDETFDVVFIDACHEFRQVARDLDNVLNHIHDRSIVIIHDLWPATRELTAQHFCGDGYKLLAGLVFAGEQGFMMMDDTYGTLVWENPRRPLSTSAYTTGNLTYDQFIDLMHKHQTPRYSLASMQQHLRNLDQ